MAAYFTKLCKLLTMRAAAARHPDPDELLQAALAEMGVSGLQALRQHILDGVLSYGVKLREIEAHLEGMVGNADAVAFSIEDPILCVSVSFKTKKFQSQWQRQ